MRFFHIGESIRVNPGKDTEGNIVESVSEIVYRAFHHFIAIHIMLLCREIFTPCAPFICFAAKRITDSHMSACIIESSRCCNITDIVNRNQIVVSVVVFHRLRVGIFHILHNAVILTRHTFHEEIFTGFCRRRQLPRIILIAFRCRCDEHKDSLRLERVRLDILHFRKRQNKFDSVLLNAFVYGNRFAVYNAACIFKGSCFNFFQPAIRNNEFRQIGCVCKCLRTDADHLRADINL